MAENSEPKNTYTTEIASCLYTAFEKTAATLNWATLPQVYQIN
jgi:hypothetical protein